ncbi:chemotaxis protein CheB [Amantichitinum ursilacus]|uniref:Chemotaxis protein methyltransferase Cher2 n=1 Tax=Amantichitinum ursilacus TaxID=857265 RepID=A0A0N0XK95_9NEIS|nr:chemotaxis protein CheB [Amantichitinum ursilacus]KPC52587.1 Chemotaxis protein methyltransferase Cher2 [Amantichitinum ursilacus]
MSDRIAQRRTAANLTHRVRIAALGCSAGGLDALIKFLSHMPVDTGMACVIVQHLAPDHVSALPEILQRYTRMPVQEVRHNTRVEANHIYVIPPVQDLEIVDEHLHLSAPVERAGLRLPIDRFFKSLAQARQKDAIGIVLSGMGSDGTAGLVAIKNQQGRCLSQDPATASASSMPLSAIAAGVVDTVAAPEALPAQLLGHAASAPVAAAEAEPVSDASPSAMAQIIELLQRHCHNDFSLYKPNTLERRVERRVALHRFESITEYARWLGTNPHEVELLYKELLIGVTHFFRDPEIWEYLLDEGFPALFARSPQGKCIRIWVAACSSGEEAYSMAILFAEALRKSRPAAKFTLQIYATDLDIDAVNRARKGVFARSITSEVSAEYLSRYFVEQPDGYRIKKDIRDCIVFATQNLISDPPFTRLDVLSCRNLLIYFNPQLQKKLFPLFHYALNTGGLLVLGSAETSGNAAHLFAPVRSRLRIFWRQDQPLSFSELVFPDRKPEFSPVHPPSTHSNEHMATENLGALTDQLIQQTYAPPAVLVNADGDILYISGRTGAYLEPAAGKVSINIHAMAREGLREALIGVLPRAQQAVGPILLKGVKIASERRSVVVDITVSAIEKPAALRGQLIIVFREVPAARRGKKQDLAAAAGQEELQTELQQAREALQHLREQMQSSLEELRSTNEELQSANEELQSTNEELTTSKEEMQSMNEELQTVNAEMQSSVDDLNEVKNDLTNLLNSTEIATIFLDNELRVRRFTSHVSSLFNLIQSDIGRPLSDMTSMLEYPELKPDAKEVLRSLVFQEKQISTVDGRWFRVRIMPYRTLENLIDGVVITFMNITELHQLKAKLSNE